MVSIELQRSERRKEDWEGRRHAWQQGKGHGEVTSPFVYKPPPSPSTCSSTTTADGRGGIRSGLHTSRLGHNDYCVYIRFWENFQRNKQDISKAGSTARAARRPLATFGTLSGKKSKPACWHCYVFCVHRPEFYTMKSLSKILRNYMSFTQNAVEDIGTVMVLFLFRCEH